MLSVHTVTTERGIISDVSSRRSIAKPQRRQFAKVQQAITMTPKIALTDKNSMYVHVLNTLKWHLITRVRL